MLCSSTYHFILRLFPSFIHCHMIYLKALDAYHLYTQEEAQMAAFKALQFQKDTKLIRIRQQVINIFIIFYIYVLTDV